MGDKNTSTLQSYIDSATGAAQSVIGSITGNTSDQVWSPLQPSNLILTKSQNAGQAKQNKADLENEASHATAKIGNYSASSSGAITKDDPNRTEGSWAQTIGSGKEALGGLIGSEVRSFPFPLSFPINPYLTFTKHNTDFFI